MIDIGYVESRLNQEPKDERLPLRSWVRDLVSDVRKANSKLYGSICLVTKLRDEVKYLESRMTKASEQPVTKG